MRVVRRGGSFTLCCGRSPPLPLSFGGFAGMFKGKTNKYKGVSLVKLAALHKRIMQGVSNVRKVSFKWECLVLRCIELEYIVSGCVPPVPIKRKTAEGGTFYVTTRGGGMANVAAPRGGAVPPQVLSAIKRGFASSGIALPPGVDPKEVDLLSEKVREGWVGEGRERMRKQRPHPPHSRPDPRRASHFYSSCCGRACAGASSTAPCGACASTRLLSCMGRSTSLR